MYNTAKRINKNTLPIHKQNIKLEQENERETRGKWESKIGRKDK